MPNLNKDLQEIGTLKHKIMRDLEALSGICSRSAKEINSRLHDELLRKNGSTNGLEDFTMLNMIVKKNAIAVKNAHTLLNRVQTTEGYSVSEENVPDENKELEELFEG